MAPGSALLDESAIVTVCPETTATVVVPPSLLVCVPSFPAVTSTDQESVVPAATWGTSIVMVKVSELAYATVTEESEEALTQLFRLLAEILKVSSEFPLFSTVNV